MKLVRLTDVRGDAVYVVPVWIQFISEPILGIHPRDAHCHLELSGTTLGVRETVDEVRELLKDVEEK